MAARRSNRFNPDVDPALLSALETVGGGYAPYDVELFSGYRPGDPRFHGKQSAVDVNLIDRKSGKALPNYQNAESAAAYQAYANQVYQWALQNDPALAQKLRWGGYFSGGKGTYGAMDLMHFDVGGGPGGAGMAGGSWEGGFNPDALKTWGLASAGGIGTGNVTYTPEQRRNAIASIESAGAGDYGALGAIVNRQGDRAYGRYQVMGSNIPAWTKQVLGREMTPDQFLADPKAQDAVFDAMFGGYVKQYGERGAAQAWFGGPGNVGKEGVPDMHGTTTGGYGDKYLAALGGGGPTVRHPPNPTVGATPEAPTAPAAAPAEPEPWWQRIGKGLVGANLGKGMQQPGITPLPPQPQAALAQVAPVPGFDVNQADRQRQEMAMALARLNSGKLFVG